MTCYQLAKPISWAGTLHSGKRTEGPLLFPLTPAMADIPSAAASVSVASATGGSLSLPGVAKPWSDEPYALIGHVRICGGSGGKPRSDPACIHEGTAYGQRHRPCS
jgi:hypothetical protein